MQAGGQRAQLAEGVFRCFQVATGHRDLASDQQRVSAPQRRLVQAENFVQDFQRFIPAPRGGQRFGQLPGDRRCDLPG